MILVYRLLSVDDVVFAMFCVGVITHNVWVFGRIGTVYIMFYAFFIFIY